MTSIYAHQASLDSLCLDTVNNFHVNVKILPGAASSIGLKDLFFDNSTFFFRPQHAFKSKLPIGKSSVLECTESINIFFEDVSLKCVREKVEQNLKNPHTVIYATLP